MNDDLQAQFQKLTESRLGLYGPSWILCDQNGRVVNHNGLIADLGLHLNSGDFIGDAVLAVASLFPVSNEVIHLKHVQISQDRYFDIYLFDENESVWVVFIETTPYALQMQDMLQKYNQLKLRIPEKEKSAGLDILNLLGFTCFEYVGDQLFRPLTKASEWCKGLYGHFLVSASLVDLVDFHPFLEVFLEECRDFWESPQAPSIQSGIWVQQNGDDHSFYLRAEAILFEERKLLLIGPAENSADSVQELIQKARSKMLSMEELEKSKESLQSLLAFKDQFVSIISHDLRAPLASVISLLQLLIDGFLPKEGDGRTTRDFLLAAKHELDQVLEFNQKVYNWTNLELGRLHVEKQWQPLAAMVTNSIRGSQSLLGDKRIQVLHDVDQELFVLVDRSLFNHSISNLIANATKFTPSEGKITAETNFLKGELQLFISDTGSGMDPETLANCLSGKVFKSSHGTRGERGTGLGLSICKKVVEAHGFHLTAHSNPGQGSQFIISIPSDHVKNFEELKKSCGKKEGRIFKFF